MTKETHIQRNIQDYLDVLEKQGKLYYFRSSSGAVKTDTGRFFRAGKKGGADITILCEGKYLACEVKNEKGRQSPAQKETEQLVRQCGGEYHIVRSIADVEAVLKPLL